MLGYFDNGADRVGNESIISLMAGGVKKEVFGLSRDSRFLANGTVPHFEGYRWEEISW